MNTYRLYCEAVKSSGLGSDALLRTIPCDRKATLKNVVICSRTGITASAVNYSKLQILNGSTVVFERSFASTSLTALTNEVLEAISDNSVESTTELQVKYVATGTGLALDLDLLLIFEPARG